MMNEFDERFMNKVLALHTEMNMCASDDTETRLWHVLRSMIEFCDAQHPRINFDLLLQNVREDFNSQ